MLSTRSEEISKSITQCVDQTNQWFSTHNGTGKSLNRCLIGFNELVLAVPSTIDNEYGLIPPWLYLFHEADQELDSTITQLYSGMYKESLRTLRSFIELNLLGIHYFTTEDKADFLKWLFGQKNTPYCKQLLDGLVRDNEQIKKLDNIGWSKSIYDIYKELSAFVHTSGNDGSFLALRDSNILQFNTKGIEHVMPLLILSIQLVSAARVACFPMSLRPLPLFEKFGFGGPASGFFEDDQVNRVIDIFTSDSQYTALLKKICDEDEHTNNLVDGIRSLPDLSLNEISDSFKKWLDSTEDIKEREKIKQSLKGKDPDTAYAMVKAMQRAFIKVSFPVINAITLGLWGKEINHLRH